MAKQRADLGFGSALDDLGSFEKEPGRTGRNAQFNIKARPETIQAYCDIADENGWGLGETLEYAVDLLRKMTAK